jgi:replicative DNA helicase
MTIPIDRLPPQSLEAEESTLGSILLDPIAIERVRPLISPDDFYIIKHQWVYAAALALYERRAPIDALTLQREIEARGQINELGGPAFLTYLMTVVPTALHAEGYAQIVKATARRRGLLRAAGEAARRAYEEDGSIDDQINQTISELRELQTRGLHKAVSIHDAVSTYHERAREWRQNPLKPGEVRGLSFGFNNRLDFTSGYDPGDLVVLAGRPAMGKSALGFQVAYNVALSGKRAIIFSLEMTQDQVVERLAGGLSKIDRKQVRDGRLTEAAWQRYTAALARIRELDLHIHDAANMTTSALAAITLELMPALVVIDHLGRISDPAAQKNELEAKRIGRITKALKTLAKESGTVVLVLVQLNRAVEARLDKRPTLADLRDSGEIEEDADDVLAIYRDDYYNSDTANKQVAEIIPRKLRNGDTDEGAELKFEKQVAWFSQLDPALWRPPD